MDVRLKEKMKTWILVLLLATSIVQFGIHWSRQVQSGPFRFITDLFSNVNVTNIDEMSVEKKVEYIAPNRMIVSDEESKRWELNYSSDAWHKTWDDFKTYYFPLLLTTKPDKQRSLSTWNSLITSNRMVLIEFENPVSTALLPWLTGRTSDNNTIQAALPYEDIAKIAIVPKENVNETDNTIYVLANSGVFRYTLSIPKGALPKSWYIMDQENLRNKNNRLLSLMGETYKLENASPDLLLSNEANNPVSLPVYEAKKPDAFPFEYMTDNLQALQNSILLNKKDSLLTRLDNETGDVVFSDTENLYRVDVLGNLTYQYLPEITDITDNMENAYAQAISFIEDRRWLVGEASIILSNARGISLNQEDAPYAIQNETNKLSFDSSNRDSQKPDNDGKMKAYQFSFIYRMDGNSITGLDMNQNMVAPIIITASENRVLSCHWSIRQFTLIDAKEWNQFFVDLDEDISRYLPVLIKKDQQLTMIRNGYLLPIQQKDMFLSPQWFLTSNTIVYHLPMKVEVE